MQTWPTLCTVLEPVTTDACIKKHSYSHCYVGYYGVMFGLSLVLPGGSVDSSTNGWKPVRLCQEGCPADCVLLWGPSITRKNHKAFFSMFGWSLPKTIKQEIVFQTCQITLKFHSMDFLSQLCSLTDTQPILISTIKQRNVNVAKEIFLFLRIFTACSLEIFVPGALSGSVPACTQTHTPSPLLKKTESWQRNRNVAKTQAARVWSLWLI